MNYAVVPALPVHVGPVAAALAAADRNALEATGLPPRRGLRLLLGVSSYARTAILHGRPVGMWGITGTAMSTEGEVWLALGEAARAVPFTVAREAIREVGRLLVVKREIRSSLLCRDARALRFARFLGFEVTERRVQPTEHFMAVLRAP
jgi:hypothetical protein